jgi:hypothetical protein
MRSLAYCARHESNGMGRWRDQTEGENTDWGWGAQSRTVRSRQIAGSPAEPSGYRASQAGMGYCQTQHDCLATVVAGSCGICWQTKSGLGPAVQYPNLLVRHNYQSKVFTKASKSSKSWSGMRQRGIAESSGLPPGSSPWATARLKVASS